MNPEHSPHCRACKERVGALLTAIYGECFINHQFPWPSHPKDYANTPMGNLLARIRAALGDLRGHRDFIKSAQMPPCDYYIPDPPFIVEFDESQHFSQPRLITLGNYSENIPIGFSKSRWQELCRALDARDDQPFDRDERRAWYDTLRDLLPPLHGFNPTARLYASDIEWCALDATSAADLAVFERLIRAGRSTGVRFRP